MLGALCAVWDSSHEGTCTKSTDVSAANGRRFPSGGRPETRWPTRDAVAVLTQVLTLCGQRLAAAPSGPGEKRVGCTGSQVRERPTGSDAVDTARTSPASMRGETGHKLGGNGGPGNGGLVRGTHTGERNGHS